MEGIGENLMLEYQIADKDMLAKYEFRCIRPEEADRDEFFTDANLYNPAGKNIMLLGLDVLPEYRRQGIAKELVYSYARRERENGRQLLILTCLKSKVKMYEKMGFVDRGIANSTWGGEEWHEMNYRIGI
jgi:GNAT superfamily N-acetyltransferase